MPNKFLNRIHKNDLKILLLTDGIPPFIMGGMQRHSFNLAKYFTFAGVDITLVHCVQMKECIETSIPSEIEVNEFLFGKESSVFIESICLQFPAPSKLPGHYIRNSYRYSELVYEKIKSRLNEFDFIYAKGFSAWKLLKEKKLGLKCPPVGIKFHGYEMYQTAANLKMKLEHFMLRPAVKWNTLNADVVFSYGGKITDIIKSLRVSKDKIIEASSGVDENIIRDPLEINVNLPLKFCFVGRYERRKGVEELTEAIHIMLKMSLEFEFHFVGPIPLPQQILNDKVIYYGAKSDQQDVIEILDQCDVLVCPSFSEGMPNVILEAMSRGLAIVATDVGAVGLMVDEKNGVLLKSCSTNVICESLVDIMNFEPKIIKNWKRESLKKITTSFTWDKISEKLINETIRLSRNK